LADGLRVGVPSSTRSVAYENQDIGAIHCCFRFWSFCSFKSQHSEGEWGWKMGQKSVLFDPLVNNSGGLVEQSTGITCATLQF